MPEEPNHLCVRGGTDEGHVAVSEGAIDFQVEARLGRGISVLSEGLHTVSGQVKVEAVGADLRSGHLMSREGGTLDQTISDIIKYTRTRSEITVTSDITIWTTTIIITICLLSKFNS